jgi:hypothetical protein
MLWDTRIAPIRKWVRQLHGVENSVWIQKEANMKRVRTTQWLIPLAIWGVLAWIMFAFPWKSSSPPPPAWVDDAGDFLRDVRTGIQMYQVHHQGKPPTTLAELYPEHVADARITRETALFGGSAMRITAHKPLKLGNPDNVVISVQLRRKVESRFPFRGMTLKGDLAVSFTK